MSLGSGFLKTHFHSHTHHSSSLEPLTVLTMAGKEKKTDDACIPNVFAIYPRPCALAHSGPASCEDLSHIWAICLEAMLPLVQQKGEELPAELLGAARELLRPASILPQPLQVCSRQISGRHLRAPQGLSKSMKAAHAQQPAATQPILQRQLCNCAE